MADCIQLLSENRLNGCQIFGRFGFLKTESKLIFGFPYIPSTENKQFNLHLITNIFHQTW